MLTVQHIFSQHPGGMFRSVEGERGIVLLTGGNGSGKSTVLKTIYGLLKPWKVARTSLSADPSCGAQTGRPSVCFASSAPPLKEGRIVFNGEDITALPPEAMIRRGIVYMPQKKNVFDDFTVEENLLTSASLYPKPEARRRVDRVFDELPRLAQLRKRTPFNLSGGEKQMLAFGAALCHTGRMFLLDEPFAGADDTVSAQITGLIKSQRSRSSFFIVEHKRHFLEGVVTHEIKLELGRVVTI